jgi:hypothetical protein
MKTIIQKFQNTGLLVMMGLVILLLAIPSCKSPDQPQKPSISTLSIEKNDYDFGEKVVITLTDLDQNKRPQKAEKVEVEVSVWRGTDSEVLELQETEDNTGIFSNKKGLVLTKDDSKPNDGRLSVKEGDVIVAIYNDPDQESDICEDRARIKGGLFSYDISEEVQPSRPYLVPESFGPIVKLVNPAGTSEEYVGNQIIVKSDDLTVLMDIVTRYDGRIIHDGKLGPVDESTPQEEIREVPDQIAYKLVQVNPEKAKLENIEERLNKWMGPGRFVFSSKQGLQMLAIVEEQQALQRKVSLNMVTTYDGCPCERTREIMAEDRSGYEDALQYPWFTSLASAGTEYLGVSYAWQLIDGFGIPGDIPTELYPYEWSPVRAGIVDDGFNPNADWPDEVLPDWCRFQDFPLFPIGTDCSGRNRAGCGSSACPWHGTMVYGVLAGVSNNRLGAAGTSSVCDGSLVEVMLSRDAGSYFSFGLNIALQARGGADVINISAGSNCGPACRLGGFFWGTDVLESSIRTARDHGALVFASAGNEGSDLDADVLPGGFTDIWQVPCELDNVICVSSINYDCTTPAGSPGADCFNHRNHNFGSNVDVWAPDQVKVLAPNDTPPPADTIYQPGGTSIATPYTAGIFALAKSLIPQEYRDRLDHDAAMEILEATNWSPATTAVSISDRVNDHSGLIYPYGIVKWVAENLNRWTDDDLVLEEKMIDDHEPNDGEYTTLLTRDEPISGILHGESDIDVYTIRLSNHYEAIPAFSAETYPGEMEILTSGTHLGAGVYNLEPGEHTFTIRRIPGTSPIHLFNCYEWAMNLTLAPFDPDVFDDEDAATPPPGPWPVARNDEMIHSTPLRLEPDPERISTTLATIRDLNFDVDEDRDYFKVFLPEIPETCECPPISDTEGHSRLIVTIEGDHTMDIFLHYPGDASSSINAYREERAHHTYTVQRLEIPCPSQYRTREEDRLLLAADGSITFSLAPSLTRTFYDMTIEYEYFQSDECGMSPFPHAGIFNFPREEEEVSLFPGLHIFWDCLSNPMCDPAEEFWQVNWLGGDLNMIFEYGSPAESGNISFALVDAQGKELAIGKTIQLESTHAVFEGKDLKQHGALGVDLKDLKAGRYYFRIDAPYPSLFVIREGKQNERPHI